MYDDLIPELDSYDILDDDDSFVYHDTEHEEHTPIGTSLSNLFRFCLKPTILEAYASLLHIFLVCLVYRAITTLLRIPRPFHHLTSAASGLYALWVIFGANAIYTAVLSAIGCAVLSLSQFVCMNQKGYTILAVFLIYLLSSEFGLVNPATWERIRGPQMIMCMKIISYAFDLERSASLKFDFMDFIGYSLCPGNIIFGPWTSFAEYVATFENDEWDLKWLGKISSSFIKSVFFFAMSVCILEWLIPDESSPAYLMYRDAMLFRVGHYFVSYVSETSAACAGFAKTEVTRPLTIEVPQSLVQVVVYWNLPIHRWLKTYVFKTTLPAGTFVAVMSTYFVSALLHGANVKLSAILLSLGLYTYVEYSLRKTLCVKLNACVGARPCSHHCVRHKLQPSNNILVYLFNFAFILLAGFHLAYLGCIIDNTGNPSDKPPFHRWEEFSYISHITVLLTYCIYIFLKLF